MIFETDTIARAHAFLFVPFTQTQLWGRSLSPKWRRSLWTRRLYPRPWSADLFTRRPRPRRPAHRGALSPPLLYHLIRTSRTRPLQLKTQCRVRSIQSICALGFAVRMTKACLLISVNHVSRDLPTSNSTAWRVGDHPSEAETWGVLDSSFNHLPRHHLRRAHGSRGQAGRRDRRRPRGGGYPRGVPRAFIRWAGNPAACLVAGALPAQRSNTAGKYGFAPVPGSSESIRYVQNRLCQGLAYWLQAASMRSPRRCCIGVARSPS